jgi:predicted nucleic acid-binding protein
MSTVLIYLDANVVIYLIEQPLAWGPRAAAYVAAMKANADQIVLSDLHRLECLVAPLGAGAVHRVAQFNAFFASADVRMVSLTPAVCERAATIRANHRFRPLDALHLAAAVEHGCARFVSNDMRLSTFTDISVVRLP